MSIGEEIEHLNERAGERSLHYLYVDSEPQSSMNMAIKDHVYALFMVRHGEAARRTLVT